ncbi:acyl-CoA N-acyltransferase [Chaetomium fimeti]|uniref:Acyl-CoA N-acyltransferase n=1 Tax=Chaetomium fimeti TaxID=1854472 RepID=A0AAE0HDK0_9PEZI|nr:acyl-CoA N-acyltransferase [Chaetomium fimeti]
MPFRLRPATESDLPLLGTIHQSAISTFAQIPELAAAECSLPPLPLALLQTFEVVIAVEDSADGGATGDPEAAAERIKGFVALRLLDGVAFIAMICVRATDQRQGVGRELLAHAIAQSETRGFRAISLTTFRDVPWNGKWYRQMGFAEIADKEVETELGPEHMTMLRGSRDKHELDGSPWRWVVMARWL